MVWKNKTDETLSVAFIIPTFNAEKYIGDCIRSIKKQKYPKDKTEIIISDGGSIDKTLHIVRKHNCKILYNKYQRADPGIALGLMVSESDINFVVNADNELPQENWIHLMILAFKENNDVFGVFTRTLKNIEDSAINRYWILLNDHNPLNWFIYKKVVDQTEMRENYGIIKKAPHYIVFNFNPENYPPICLAQGFGVRRGAIEFIHTKSKFEHFNIVIEMLRKGLKVAYVPESGIYHHTLENFTHFIRKFHFRIVDRLNTTKYGFRSRQKFMTKDRKIRQYLWFIYSLIPIFPLVDVVKGFLKDNDLAWFYHPIICFSLTILIVISFIEYKISRVIHFINNKF